MLTGGNTYCGKSGKFKGDKNYISGNKGDDFQDKIIKNILGIESNDV